MKSNLVFLRLVYQDSYIRESRNKSTTAATGQRRRKQKKKKKKKKKKSYKRVSSQFNFDVQFVNLQHLTSPQRL